MEPLALTDNPFDPRDFQKWLDLGVDEKYLENINNWPLRIDVCKELDGLYFKGFPLAENYEARWQDYLEDRGYRPNKSRGHVSSIVVIRGKSGSGKTTLAASFLRYLRSCGSPDNPEWVVIETAFRDTDLDRTPLTEKDILPVMDAFGDKLKAVGKGNWVCALIDDVTAEVLHRIVEKFKEASHCRRIFVVTSDHIPLLDSDLSEYPFTFEDYPLESVDDGSAVSYAKFRIDQFRHVKYPSNTLADPMFPLLADHIKSWIGPKEGAASGNPLVVRVLNKKLKDTVDALLKRFKLTDIQKLPPPQNVSIQKLREVLQELSL